MAPPQLGDEQIVAGPGWDDECDADGRWRSLQTPAGEYSVASILAKLPIEQRPDVIVCLVDSSRRNLPRNLGAFRGPKVLLLADTHHLTSPLMTMLRYAAAEPFDRIVFLYDRHHAPIFGAAGFRNLFWFPGLTFPHDDAVVHAARSSGEPESHVAFVGQTAKYHPRRARLLQALKSAGVPLAQRQIAQADALRFYGASALGFNASLNGDLNLRVFEILASGALLLTDVLGSGSGLAELAAHGAEFVCYASEAELVEKARHYLAHPLEARALGATGRAWFDRVMNAERRRAMFRALALDGVAPEPFPLPETATTRIQFQSTHALLSSVMVYEGVQELHRTQERVTVATTAGAPRNFAELCTTLPRVKLTQTEGMEIPDLLVTSVPEIVERVPREAPRVWCADAREDQLPDLAVVFQAAGYAPASNDVAVYCHTDPVADASEPLAEALAS